MSDPILDQLARVARDMSDEMFALTYLTERTADQQAELDMLPKVILLVTKVAGKYAARDASFLD